MSLRCHTRNILRREGGGDIREIPDRLRILRLRRACGSPTRLPHRTPVRQKAQTIRLLTDERVPAWWHRQEVHCAPLHQTHGAAAVRADSDHTRTR